MLISYLLAVIPQKKPSVSTEGNWAVGLRNWGRVMRKAEAVCGRELCDGCPVLLWPFIGNIFLVSSFF